MKLELNCVGKQYSQDFWALKDFSLQLKPGVLGLLGENGAGKSTLMRIISTITSATTGTILWNGVDIFQNPDAIRENLGYLPQDFGVYPHLNAVEFLEYMAAIKGVHRKEAKTRIDELLHVVNLYDVRKRAIGGYSGGMRQRIGIAQALLNDPKILIVDEPTVGLDPVERVRFRNLLSDLSGDRIVIFSTHIVSDVEATAESIAILSKGHLLHHSSPDELLETVQGKVWEWSVSSSEVQELRKKWMISSTVRSGGGVLLRIVSDESPSNDAQLVSPGMEDAYLHCISSHGKVRQ
ncbi:MULTISPECIES: ABC transporter ATP-binding protein [unclassified Brevibacillus]|uniref:ABC transporter ATP-binding protein n=1 Tax=unclassified Brevibacillus TaxID=2684853 RepID=UPI00156AFDAF|nr:MULTISPECIES: ABC transporter ATP-binding protein [unclassified Brevibacillus]MDH6353110.1 ABC-2 type transport system ATP-binding protein [Brevibacillus sp. 1238]NRQ56522.1 ABC transporter ATP-binding protein [Brevibacillus sp. HD1.4A]